MSIPEAAQLLLQAGMIGFKAQIFVMDMGEPVKIIDLAKNLIRLSGVAEDKIEITLSTDFKL
jgi:FlaA1/EpsC-like NDP-sugar epimerase